MSSGVGHASLRSLSNTFAWVRGKRYVDVPMAQYTSLRVGGPADLLLVPADVHELRAIVACASAQGVPVTWLGNGSNLIVRSRGIRGIVVSLHDALRQVSALARVPDQEMQPGECVRVKVGAGAPLTRILHLAIQQGLKGLSFAVGIPGTLGGAIVMNAGADAGAIWDVVECVRLLLPNGEMVDVGRETVAVGYRFAVLPEHSVVLEATLRAERGSPSEVREEVRQLYRCRRESQPLSHPNAGSIFKNPPGERAGRLIDQLGLKGFRVGDAQVSRKHANFIVNRGRASVEEVLALIEHIQRCVLAQTGILLEEEVRIVGS
ncbi:MAG TPA: UDP-N-acetylmuramate dehydrogenase [Candidatus Tectomicrobia bacterium]|nr:UDP-N-acetylmuramate dehydrogenase [Candidatus Tectomicrobia bacterium]